MLNSFVLFEASINMHEFDEGLYDLLLTKDLWNKIQAAGLVNQAELSDLSNEELHQRLTLVLAREISGLVSDLIANHSGKKLKQKLETFPELLKVILEEVSSSQPVDAKALRQILPPPPRIVDQSYPDTPLAVSALLTGSSRAPALRVQLIKELRNCDRADWLVSFIKYSGILPLLPTLREFTRFPAPDGGPRLRVATTAYLGATDLKAVKELLELPNTEIRVSYDTRRTRLHAKAYLFHRSTGFGSAYIGSANVSKAALDEGLEWTAKISQYETGHLWKHAVASFESHWEDETEFTPCRGEDLNRFALAIEIESGRKVEDENTTFFDLQPFGFQRMILQDIQAEREDGIVKHLIISATGTGKTMVAAFDYKGFCKGLGRRARFIYIAHRKEILQQARSSFRQVLRDGSFGDFVFDGLQPTQTDFLFCTVQSWNSRNYDQFADDHFEYVVLDEAHHASANSYQRLVDHVKPKSILGLTATPERTDGKDIRDDFGGTFTHEIRLPEAVERTLLSPFHYYGIPDEPNLDFSAIAWRRGGYDSSALSGMLTGNESRAEWVINQTVDRVADITQIRALGFCVRVDHAEFMARYCSDNGIPSIALSADSPVDLRSDAIRRLKSREINIIFTVDLYNEGIDIPFVDTVIFLRPTESLTVFLQQLGRGLRLHDEKSHLTVLDFIAPQHRNFNFARRFRALTSRPELRIDNQIKADMPYVPSGCFVQLEKQAKEHILSNIRSATVNLRRNRFFNELRHFRVHHTGDMGLKAIMDHFHIDSPDEIYKRGLPRVLLCEVDNQPINRELNQFTKPLAVGFRRFTLMDDTHLMKKIAIALRGRIYDPEILSMLQSVLWSTNKPGDGSLSTVSEFIYQHRPAIEDLVELLEWLIENRKPIRKLQFPKFSGTLNVHASYSRAQILLALGFGTFDSPRSSREGVLHIPGRKLDAFFADINKSESDFSPTTMYEDYAITDRKFRWDSQSVTSPKSETGKRYINHQKRGYTPLLFIREQKNLANGLTSPYFYAGPLKYLKHEGSKPISFTWELEVPLPASALAWARRIT